jgi:hypothetical protein
VNEEMGKRKARKVMPSSRMMINVIKFETFLGARQCVTNDTIGST